MIEKRGVMADMAGSHRVVDPVGKTGYELAFEDTFDGDALDQARWLPHYLPQWSSHEAAAARYKLGDGVLRLLIEADQQPWCREFDGQTRVSSLQTGVFAGPAVALQPWTGRAPGTAQRQALHAAVRPVRAPGQSHRRPPLHGCAVDDRL